MAPPNNRQKMLFLLLGISSLFAGFISVVMMLKIILETGDFFGLISNRLVGVASVPVPIGVGVFVLSKALKGSHLLCRSY